MPMDNDRSGIRRRIAVGAVGAAAVLGVGAYAITANLTGNDTHTAEPGALAPAVSAGSSLPTASAVPSSVGSVDSIPAASPSSAPATATSRAAIDPKTQKQIDDARAAQKKHGVELTRPLPAPTKMLAASAVKTQVKDTKEGYLRITTARGDLTGQKDQQIAGDAGTKFGEISCTQKFRFAANVKPKTIPNMMICWRLSDERSVVTLGTVREGKPTPSTYAAVISREWAKLG